MLQYSDTTSEKITSKAKWESNDPDIANIDSKAIATCKKVGNVTLTASYQDFTGKLNIACEPKPFISELLGVLSSDSVVEGDTITLTPVAKMNNNAQPPSDLKFTWISDDETIATVDEKGIITGIKYGSVNITVEIDDTELDMVVKAEPLVYEITVQPATEKISIGFSNENNVPTDILTLEAGDFVYNLNTDDNTVKIKAFEHKTDGSKSEITQYVNWDFQTKNIVSIDFSGRIKILNEGSTKVSIKNYLGLDSINDITINVQRPLSLYLTHDTANQIKLEWFPKFNTDEYSLQWKTSDETAFSNTVSLTETSFIHDILDSTKTYQYQIAYKKLDGSFSEYSDILEVKPHLNTWRKKNAFPARSHASSALIGNKLYVFGGEITNTDGSTSTSDEIWVYDIDTQNWKLHSTMLSPRQDAALCELNGSVYLFGGFDSSLPAGSQILDTVEVYHPTSGSAQVASVDVFSPLAQASCNVADNAFYVVGGTNGTDTLNSINVYSTSGDFDTSITLTQTASYVMQEARRKHESVILNNRLYITGGLNPQDVALAKLEVFDISQQPIAALPFDATELMPTARYDFQFKLIGNRLYAIGGLDNNGDLLRSVETILDPSTDTLVWATADPMPFENAGFIAEYEPNLSTLFVFGGLDSALAINKGNANQMLYSGTRLSWHPLLNSAEGIYDTSAGIVGDNLYLIGGRSENGKVSNRTQVFNISENSWVTASRKPDNLITGRVNAMTVSSGSIMLTIGGQDENNIYLGSVEVFSLTQEANNWRSLPTQMAFPRAYACAAVHGNYIYVFGGINDDGFVDTIERLNIKTSQWTDYGTMKNSRAGHSCVTIQDSIYLIGGFDNIGTHNAITSVESYQPLTQTFNNASDLFEARITPATSVYNNRIYVFGGINGSLAKYEGSSTTEIYTPFYNTWEQSNDLGLTPTNNPFSTVIGNKIYVFANNHSITSAENVSPVTRRNSTSIFVLE